MWRWITRSPSMSTLLFGPSNSGHFFLEPQKNAPKIQHFLGDIKYFTKFSLDSHRCNAPNGKLASGPHQEPFTSIFWHSNVPASVAHLCVVYPTTPLKVVKIFSWKTFKTGSKWAPTSVHAICFDGNHAVLYRWKDVLCPTRWLEQRSVSILRCKPLIFRLHGFREHPKGSNCQVESPLDFHSHPAAFSFTTLNLCSLHRPLAAQSWVQSWNCYCMAWWWWWWW